MLRPGDYVRWCAGRIGRLRGTLVYLGEPFSGTGPVPQVGWASGELRDDFMLDRLAGGPASGTNGAIVLLCNDGVRRWIDINPTRLDLG